jgi:hypothetical protein
MSKQRNSIKHRKRHGVPERVSPPSPKELEDYARALVDQGICTPVILGYAIQSPRTERRTA